MEEKPDAQETNGVTPSKAIGLECKWCMGTAKSFRCDSKLCKLTGKFPVQGIGGRALSPLMRIKLHCLDCVETRPEVRACTGKLLHDSRHCHLQPYRLGHNPKRKGIGSASNFQKTPTHDGVSGSKN